MKNKQQSDSKKFYLALIFFILVCCFLGFTYLYIEKMLNESMVLSEKVHNDFLLVLPREEGSLEELSALSGELSNYLITKGDIPEILGQLENLAHGLKVEPAITSVIEKKEGEVIKSMIVNISVSGKFDEIKNYVNLIEAMPYNLFINSFSIREGNEERPWIANIEISFVIKND